MRSLRPGLCCGPVGCLRHPLTRRFPQCNSGPFTWGHFGKRCFWPTLARTVRRRGYEENPPAAPTPGENDLHVSPSQPTPWRPASFLPGALPTACGGAPGNLPASTDLQASWVRTAHRLSSMPRFSGRLPSL